MNSHQRRKRWRAIERDPDVYILRFGRLRIWQKLPKPPIPYDWSVGLPPNGFTLDQHGREQATLKPQGAMVIQDSVGDWSPSNPPMRHGHVITVYAGQAKERSMSLEDLVRETREKNPDAIVMVTNPLLTKEMLRGIY